MSSVSIGPANALPAGEMKCVMVNGRRLLLAHVDGQFYAVDERCPHEDASLSKGSLHGYLIGCPLHGSRFDVRSGRVLEEPADKDLETYPVEERDGMLFVSLP
jgi:nitrite reductase/ring-hydroxylating ferredoxin subunit